MISRIETQRTAAATALSDAVNNISAAHATQLEANTATHNSFSATLLNHQEKFREVFGKIELAESGLRELRRETTELLNTLKSEIETDHDSKMTVIRGRQQEIIESITSGQRSVNLSCTEQRGLKTDVNDTKMAVNNITSRVSRTRLVKNNVGLVPRLSANSSKKFTATASHNSNDAWKVFTASTAYFWNAGVNVDEQGKFVPPISIEIQLPRPTRIHRFGLRTRSNADRIKVWTLRCKNVDGILHLVNNPIAHITNLEDRYIGGAVKYFEVPISTALSYSHYILEISAADNRNSHLNYFQLYSLDEIIEMPILSDGSYINT